MKAQTQLEQPIRPDSQRLSIRPPLHHRSCQHNDSTRADDGGKREGRAPLERRPKRDCVGRHGVCGALPGERFGAERGEDVCGDARR